MLPYILATSKMADQKASFSKDAGKKLRLRKWKVGKGVKRIKSLKASDKDEK